MSLNTGTNDINNIAMNAHRRVNNKPLNKTQLILTTCIVLFIIMLWYNGNNISSEEDKLNNKLHLNSVLDDTIDTKEDITNKLYYLYQSDSVDLEKQYPWIPTSHYKESFVRIGPLLVEKKVIINSDNALSPLIQSSIARIKPNGFVESHSHESAIEMFTVMNGKCTFIFEQINEVLVLAEDSHIVIPPNTKHSLRNDETFENCIMTVNMVEKKPS